MPLFVQAGACGCRHLQDVKNALQIPGALTQHHAVLLIAVQDPVKHTQNTVCIWIRSAMIKGVNLLRPVGSTHNGGHGVHLPEANPILRCFATLETRQQGGIPLVQANGPLPAAAGFV